MNTFEILGVQNQAVVVAAPAIVANTVALPADKPGCSNLLVTYTPAVGGNILTIAIEFGDAAGNWFSPQSSASTTLTGSIAVPISLSGGPTKFRVKLSSAGGAGSDHVSLTFQGLPSGTVVS